MRQIVLILSFLLSACAIEPILLEPYSKTEQKKVLQLTEWGFSGRLAIVKKADSWQANVTWQHQANKDVIKLSGPLGQNATLIELTAEQVTIHYSDGETESSHDIDAFVKQQLGMVVPLASLRYWVLGLPEKNIKAMMTDIGFYQAGWLIEYKQMQVVNDVVLPYKIQVLNSDNSNQIKLKLIIDEWVVHDKF